jgi:HAD superfamily hydrolase (TIGR01509 family)
VPDAVVFDNDGLLLETEACWTRAEQALFGRRGRTFTLDHKRELLGTAAEIAAAKLERMLDAPGEGPAILVELHELVLEEVARGTEPRPGARALVDALRGRVPLGLASNSPRPFVERALATAGFDGAFAVVLSADEVPRPKPAPDLYVEACARLHAEPGRAVALEDSPTGVAAARAAGMIVVGVPSLPGVALDGADVVAGSLADPAVRAAVGLDGGDGSR